MVEEGRDGGIGGLGIDTVYILKLSLLAYRGLLSQVKLKYMYYFFWAENMLLYPS